MKNGHSPPLLMGIERTSDAPLFRQVYLQLRSSILSRALPPGTRLPSTRELAEDLGIARSVVVLAYEQLLAEGCVSAKVGSGTYVAEGLADLGGPTIRKKPRLETRSRRKIYRTSPDVTEQSDERPFNLGRTLVDARTVDQWRQISIRSLRTLDRDLLGYSDPRGYLKLREAICSYLRSARAVQCDAEQILVTAGTQHAIDIIVRVLQQTGDKEVWIEDPGYPLTRQALLSAGMLVRPVPVDSDGINVGLGLRRWPRARAAFITPSHQFPIGVVLSMARRLELLNWARDNSAWIVEDDYASEFRYGGHPLASLQGLTGGDRVIYVGTLNKALFPGLRLGYAVVPTSLLDRAVTIRYLIDRQPPSLQQSVTAEFIQGGYLAAHIRRMRQLYREQRDVLVSALHRHLDGIATADPPDQGMHLVAYLSKGISDVAAEKLAKQDGVVVRALSRMYVTAPPRNGLMLGFSGYPKQVISPAVARLASALRHKNGRSALAQAKGWAP
jgi:GntR family transcriptional regulator/MocR family aminotransferase